MPNNRADKIPTSPATPAMSVSPVVLPAPGRAVDLAMCVSAPQRGDPLPIILLSHGHGSSNHLSSSNGYAPLADFWAAHGFVVIQPTHLSSKTPSLDGPDAPLFWRSRVEDMTRIVDGLDLVEASVSMLAGRLDKGRIAVAGHSMGGHTAGMLLGAGLIDPHDGRDVDLAGSEIKAGVLLTAPGYGGDDLSAFAAEHAAFFAHPDFIRMTTPTLVLVGDQDVSPHLTTRGADWHADPYGLGTGPKALLAIFGGKHGLGGVSGYDVVETTNEDPERVAAVQRLSWAYLRTALYPEDAAWPMACAALADGPDPLGRIESK